MGEHGVTVPLWSDDDGLMFSEPIELIQAFDVSSDLARDLEVWSVAWATHAGEPSHDAEAARLVRRLNDESNHHYRFVYRP